MPRRIRTEHPFLDLFVASLAPWMPTGPDHARDPPEPKVTAEALRPDLRALLDLFLAADRDLRADRFAAAARTLDIAEMRIRLAPPGGAAEAPTLEAVLADIALAREAALRRDSAHGCGAVISAVRSLAAAQRRH
jgi:hypothetical protein